MENSIEFTGYVSEKEKWKLYTNADVFVIASTTETQSLVVFEAMKAGAPVIATSFGGIRDYVKNNYNGLIFKKNDAEDLANKMMRLLHNKNLRNKLTKNGREYIENFSIEKCADSLDKYYKDVIQNN